ncbi:MAG: hypothetical protein C0606_10275 [Hyphomicrobiales bacterium]|nr:MAG: hypothetical protein C0606_10275 [Hyphomicrobiales bacterium]
MALKKETLLRKALRMAGQIALAAALTLAAGPTAAGIKASLVERDYRVHGRSAKAAVSFMKTRPFRGDYGPAMANIRPKYDLRIETRQKAGRCTVRSLSLRIRFTMTLPRAVHRASFDRRTRRAWDSFRAFTRRHELHHKTIYMGCLNRFVKKARRMSSPRSCASLQREIHRALRAADRQCDVRHKAYDRRDFRRLPNLPLFVKARSERYRHSKPTRRTAERRGHGAVPARLPSPYLRRVRDDR